MGVGSFFSSLGRADFQGAFGSIFVSDAELERGRMLDDQLTQLTAEREAGGYVTHEQALETYNRISLTAPEALLSDPLSSPWVGFNEGLGEGADNIRGAIGGTLNGVFGLAARLIPWQIWVVLLVIAIVWAWPIIAPVLGAKLAKRA